MTYLSAFLQLLHIMMEWFLVHFEYPMEYGLVTAVLSFAEKEADLSLARLAIKLREKSFLLRNSIEMESSNAFGKFSTEGEMVIKTNCGAIGANGVAVWDYASAIMIAVRFDVMCVLFYINLTTG